MYLLNVSEFCIHSLISEVICDVGEMKEPNVITNSGKLNPNSKIGAQTKLLFIFIYGTASIWKQMSFDMKWSDIFQNVEIFGSSVIGGSDVGRKRQTLLVTQSNSSYSYITAWELFWSNAESLAFQQSL